jgi:ferrochelatase
MQGIDMHSFRHDQPSDRVGILLANLGSPDNPSPGAVRRYLKQFLWDPRVVEVPRPIWWLVLNLIILNLRPRRSARAYGKIWTDQGSPLIVHSRRQAEALAGRLQALAGDRVRVALGMCYGNPSIPAALRELRDQGVGRLLVLPLYPQYSATTSAAVFDAVTEELRDWRWLPELRFVRHYPDHPQYIEALAASVRAFWAEQGRAERLVMSFHGIPRAYLEAGDPYHCECHKTARLLAERLQLAPGEWVISFQSRLGRQEWLRPYTDQTLQQLARDGVRKVQLICPGFAADCLETLEEVAMENRELFLQAGGSEYAYIPCLNDAAEHIDLLLQLAQQHTQGWPLAPEATADASQLAARRQRACALGAPN